MPSDYLTRKLTSHPTPAQTQPTPGLPTFSTGHKCPSHCAGPSRGPGPRAATAPVRAVPRLPGARGADPSGASRTPASLAGGAGPGEHLRRGPAPRPPHPAQPGPAWPRRARSQGQGCRRAGGRASRRRVAAALTPGRPGPRRAAGTGSPQRIPEARREGRGRRVTWRPQVRHARGRLRLSDTRGREAQWLHTGRPYLLLPWPPAPTRTVPAAEITTPPQPPPPPPLSALPDRPRARMRKPDARDPAPSPSLQGTLRPPGHTPSLATAAVWPTAAAFSPRGIRANREIGSYLSLSAAGPVPADGLVPVRGGAGGRRARPAPRGSLGDSWKGDARAEGSAGRARSPAGTAGNEDPGSAPSRARAGQLTPGVCFLDGARGLREGKQTKYLQRQASHFLSYCDMF